MRRFVAVAVLAAAAGCSSDPRFTLDDVGKLEVGRSTRAQVNGTLGLPEGALERFSSHQTESSRVVPPFPLSLLSWPLFISRTNYRYHVMVRFDERDLLTEGSLTVKGSSFAAFLMIIQPHSLLPDIGSEEIEKLRAIERNGVKVYVGMPDQTLDDWLFGRSEEGVDLMADLDPRQDAVRGSWALAPEGLRFDPQGGPGLLELPYVPTDRYYLRMILERVDGDAGGPFVIGLAAQDRRFAVELGAGEKRDRHGLSRLDGRDAGSHRTATEGPALRAHRRYVLSCEVRKEETIIDTNWFVTVWLDDERLIDWKGDSSRLSLDPKWTPKHPGTLFLGAEGQGYRVTRLALTCREGQARKTR
jgi:hypothetical protein